jgi:hypothetical protein
MFLDMTAKEHHMRVLGLAVAAIVVLSAVPSLAASCREEIRETRIMVDHLRPGPNTSDARRHLREAREARSERGCFREVAEARRSAERSRELDRRYSYR